MSYLYLYAPCPISELSRVFGHKPTTLTSMLDRLEAGGYIKRSVNPNDRRSFMVACTARGRQLGKKVRSLAEKFDADILGRVSSDDLKGFNRVMEAVGEVSAVTLRKPK